MQLIATPISHFSRKVRIILDLYQIPYSLVDVGNVALKDNIEMGKNPILKVPILIDGNNTVWESDYINQYIVAKYDNEDIYGVCSTDHRELNIRSVLNGAMLEEVKIILAKRTHIPVENYHFFDNAFLSMNNGLQWLENNYQYFNIEKPGYKEFHLLCFIDHLAFYEFSIASYPKLQELAFVLRENKIINQSSPLKLKVKKD